MGISPAIFNSAGQRSEHLMPGVYSRSNNVTSAAGVSTGNLCIIGESQGGEPNKLLTFASLAEAKETLVSGALLNAVGYAFNAHDTYIPQRVNVVRVGKNVSKSSLTLKSNGSDLLKVTSWDWGVHCNQLKLSITPDTNGVTLTIAYKDEEQTIKNIQKSSMKITYDSGNTPSSVVISKNSIKLSAKDTEGTEVESETFEISLDDFNTIDGLVSKINDTGIYSAENLGNSTDLSADLDTGTFNFTDSEVTLYANYAAFVDALESSTLIGDVESLDSNTRTVPDGDGEFQYFTGGSAESPDTSAYFSGLTVLETEDIQIIATPSTDKDIATAIVDHCKSMSNIINRKERTCILGGAAGMSDDDGIEIAKGFNSKYASYVVDSATAINPVTGVTETISGAMVGVMLAAMESAMNVNEPLTFKTLNVLGFTTKRTVTNIEELISSGILVCNANPENLSSYICIRAVTTYQADDLINCERSMVREDLYMNRDLRSKFVGGVGHPEDGSTTSIIQTLKDAGKDWALAGLVVKNGNDAVWNIKVSISGDKVYLTYSRYLTAPRNFVFITATNHIYETTVEL